MPQQRGTQALTYAAKAARADASLRMTNRSFGEAEGASSLGQEVEEWQ